MDFIFEFVFEIVEIFFDFKDLIKDDRLKKQPIKKILLFLLIIAGMVGSFFVLGLLCSLSILPFKSYGTIEYLGRSECGILNTAMYFSALCLSYIALLIVVLIVLGVVFAVKKSRKNTEEFTFIEKENEEEREKSHIKKVKALLGIVAVLLVIVAGIFYCYTFNTTTFTNDKIISTSFANPKGTVYSYDDVESVDVDCSDGGYFELDLHMNSGKTVEFRYEGDNHTEIEKYDDGNDYVFIADLLEKLDSTGATINFECTYNEVAEDLDNEDKSNLKKVFSFK
ncbi:MAG: hypothetical protein ACI4HL_03845 [Ruminococcus sp.]